jgi:fatty-acid desaturase
MMFWLTPAFALLGVSATVMISARVKTFMEAYQLTGSLVVIVLALVVGQATGILYLGVGMVLLIGTLIWIVDAVLIYFNLRVFNRSSLIAKL